MAAARFLVLRGTAAGPVYLAPADQPDDADTWSEDRDGAERFVDRGVAEVVRAEIVARGIAAAVVPDRGCCGRATGVA